ncbi:MAG: hypothetical protein HYX47_10310 [Burkholderiales bacterium]|nr:hypothetical protein [Burkholderiales bacterium]
MSEAAIKLLVVLAVCVGLFGYGRHTGTASANASWQARDDKRLKAESDARDAEFRRADKASGALQAELLARSITNDQLTKAFNDYKKRSPILARRPAGTPAAASAANAEPTARECVVVGAGAEPGLSLGAVWMWNSALASADKPAGACGLADTSEGACAADSGITVEDAWDNQALNARLCAEDRIRHLRLIDYIKGAKK